MASSVTATPQQTTKRPNKSVYMVLGCTVFTAIAQIMMKFGANHAMPPMHLNDPSTWTPFVVALLSNYMLLSGYIVQSGNALLLILALRDGQLSTLYPIIGLGYVWVNLLSMYFFHEQMNVWKVMGIALVIGGVGLLGWASSRS
jgi:multidrug transporter EmrE-like cation transporter